MPPTFERRTLTEPIEFRAEGKRLIASGIAIRYDSTSRDLGGFVERMAPGCAAKTIKEQDVRALVNHDPTLLLGRMSSGTLRLIDGPDALRYEVDLPDTTAGRDAWTLMERGDMTGSSFGFRNVAKPTWTKTDSGQALRTCSEISLRDVGPVTFPAYEASTAEVALRSLADDLDYDLRDLVAAADRGDLPDLIDPPPGDESQEHRDEEGRATTFRPRTSWLI